MKTAMNLSLHGRKPKGDVIPSNLTSQSPVSGETIDEGEDTTAAEQPRSQEDLETGESETKGVEITQTEAMRLFTKIPFPVPRRVIHIKPRGLE